MAWREASNSHVKNGIYGEMCVSAMMAAAAVTADIETIVIAGLTEIPEKSRLAEDIYRIIAWKKETISWEDAIDRIH
ncbi:ADP-ribosylglycohydrolase family protein [Paenibacillus alginolyticus]|nr:ADP-ribosylglycohydrolase family protein [Paenibacillus alginolyticus]MCY9667987.1 ADP-ribosylglycohydrolase family protein [Paenibacillus alginolyticus]